MEVPLIVRIEGRTNTSSDVDVTTLTVPPGELWLVLGVAVDNESGESITAAFGIIGLGGFYRIGAKQTVDTADCFSGTAWMLLREGEKLAVRVTGTSDSGRVVLIASGVIFQKETGLRITVATAAATPPSAG